MCFKVRQINFIITIKEQRWCSGFKSSWLAEQEVRGSILGLATTISEIGYLLLPSRDMAKAM